jgi:hypothetical protein
MDDDDRGYPHPKRRAATALLAVRAELKPCDSLSRIRKRASITNKSKRRAYTIDPVSQLPLCNACKRPINVRNDTQLRESMCSETWHSYGWPTFFCAQCMIAAVELWAGNMDFDPSATATATTAALRPYCIHCLAEPPAAIALYNTRFSCADAPTTPRQIMLCGACAQLRKAELCQ